VISFPRSASKGLVEKSALAAARPDALVPPTGNVCTKRAHGHGTEGGGDSSSGERRQIFEPEMIDVAPAPRLTGLDGAGDGMLRCLEVPDGVFISGRIAAANVAALHAHPELQPRVPHRAAAVATRAARLHVADATDVRTRHWRFWQHHHAWRVRTTWPSVESNDDMRFMLQIDSAR